MVLTGAEQIAIERRRQVDKEGWTSEHDADWTEGELKMAAMAYLEADGNDQYLCETNDRQRFNTPAYDYWPWKSTWWKPKDRLSNLVRAGALIAAEIDRIQKEP